jgi:4-amino-4-deoxy-L-arabinose transferase-like glycosyltransferase
MFSTGVQQRAQAPKIASVPTPDTVAPRCLPWAAAASEWTAVSAIVVVAAVVRMPELATVPRFTDETNEIFLGWRIARGEALPLTNGDAYIGSLFNYLVAAGFGVFEARLEAGRQVVMLLGALAVVPSYLLGRSVGGRAVGLLSALLLAASATHIAVNSHVAYSHSLTPLFSTTGLWLLHRAVSRGSGPHLAASGLAFGLALQTHPSAVVIWPGLSIFLLWKGRRLMGRWMLAAIVVVLLAVSNLLVFNAMTRLAGIAKTYAIVTFSWGLDGWPDRLVSLLWQVASGLGGLLAQNGMPPSPSVASIAGVTAYSALAIIGLIVLCRQGDWLLCLAMLSGLLAISFLGAKHAPVVVNGRYYALLLPLGYVSAAVAVQAFHGHALAASQRRWIGNVIVGAAVLVMVAAPLFSLHEYYERAYRQGSTNSALNATVEAVTTDGWLGDTVYLDAALEESRFTGGTLLVQLKQALKLRDQKFDVVDLEQQTLSLDTGSGSSPRLVVSPQRVEIAAHRYRLEPLASEAPPNRWLRVFRVHPLEHS